MSQKIIQRLDSFIRSQPLPSGKCHLYMCMVNLGEVMYIVERERGLPKAQETLSRIDELPIDIVNADRTLTLAAAHLKMDCPIAYADCFAAALSQMKNATLVSGDPEFGKIKPDCNVEIEWLDKEQDVIATPDAVKGKLLFCRCER